jgi:2,3-bisphosphoglycerate-independent phosphoglycerate mutase
VDLCLARIVKAVRQTEGILVVTADHGNSDDMYERNKKTGEVVVDPDSGAIKTKTSHSLNPVPVHIYAPGANAALRPNPEPDLGISSLAATCLTLLGFTPPHDYTPSIVAFED